MLLPGENYSEQLMFTLQGYKETWVDGRAARLYGEAYSSLNEASNLSKGDLEQIKQIRKAAGLTEEESSSLDLALDIISAGKKGFRLSKFAAPLILADGPLPFGDIVFLVALGIDFGFAAYEVYDHFN